MYIIYEISSRSQIIYTGFKNNESNPTFHNFEKRGKNMDNNDACKKPKKTARF